MPRPLVPLKYPQDCPRCGATMPVGYAASWSGLNGGKWYHPKGSPDCIGTLQGEPENEPETTDSTDALGVLAREIGKRIAPSIDSDAVRAIVREALANLDVDAAVSKAVAARVPIVVEVRRHDAPTVKIENAHYLMPRLLRLMGAGLHVYLWGPAGSGKTTALMQAAEGLGRRFEVDTLDPSTPKSAILGWRGVDREPAHTQFSRCWTEGKVYIADECDLGSAIVQTLFNTSLANGHAPLAWGSIPRTEGFGFAASGNTPGKPTKDFGERKAMSAAFKDRLYFVHWPLDPAIECRAAGMASPKPPRRVEHTCSPVEWVTWVQTVRAWCSQNAPEIMVTPRASLTGLTALAAGETPAEVADGLVFRGADAALRDKVLATVPLP